MANDQDFTFPTFTGALSSAVDSPPLWSLSPAASPDHSPHCNITSSTNEQPQEDEDEAEAESNKEEELEEYKKYCYGIHKEMEKYTRKSFSWIERGHFRRKKIDEEDMDMLWEDFNEELSFNRRTPSTRFDSDDDDDNKVINMGCVQLQPAALRLSKNCDKAVVSIKKQQHRRRNSGTGFVMFFKVLKNFFVLHNNNKNHCSVRTSRPPKHLSW